METNNGIAVKHISEIMYGDTKSHPQRMCFLVMMYPNLSVRYFFVRYGSGLQAIPLSCVFCIMLRTLLTPELSIFSESLCIFTIKRKIIIA